jgi:hypothetical protein
MRCWIKALVHEPKNLRANETPPVTAFLLGSRRATEKWANANIALDNAGSGCRSAHAVGEQGCQPICYGLNLSFVKDTDPTQNRTDGFDVIRNRVVELNVCYDTLDFAND